MVKRPHFVHYRTLGISANPQNFIPDDQVGENGGVTVYMEPPLEATVKEGDVCDEVRLTLATCSPKDQYNRRRGRLAAEGRMRTPRKHKIHLIDNGDDGDRLWGEIDSIVIRAWRDACMINEYDARDIPNLVRRSREHGTETVLHALGGYPS